MDKVEAGAGSGRPDGAAHALVFAQIPIAAPPDRIFAALREPDRIAQWFGWDYPGLKDEIDLIFLSETTKADARAGTVEFGEWEGASDAIALVPSGDHTLLRLTRRGAPQGFDPRTDYNDVVEGWIGFAQQLRFLLERDKKALRRTVYLSGKARPGQPLPSVALGLNGVVAAALEEPPGQLLTGLIYYRTPFQVGVAIDQWGGGLLIVTDWPPGEGRPNGGGSALLTTYSVNEDQLATLESRWRQWWTERYPSD